MIKVCTSVRSEIISTTYLIAFEEPADNPSVALVSCVVERCVPTLVHSVSVVPLVAEPARPSAINAQASK